MISLWNGRIQQRRYNQHYYLAVPRREAFHSKQKHIWGANFVRKIWIFSILEHKIDLIKFRVPGYGKDWRKVCMYERGKEWFIFIYGDISLSGTFSVFIISHRLCSTMIDEECFSWTSCSHNGIRKKIHLFLFHVWRTWISFLEIKYIDLGWTDFDEIMEM